MVYLLLSRVFLSKRTHQQINKSTNQRFNKSIANHPQATSASFSDFAVARIFAD